MSCWSHVIFCVVGRIMHKELPGLYCGDSFGLHPRVVIITCIILEQRYSFGGVPLSHWTKTNSIRPLSLVRLCHCSQFGKQQTIYVTRLSRNLKLLACFFLLGPCLQLPSCWQMKPMLENVFDMKYPTTLVDGSYPYLKKNTSESTSMRGISTLFSV